MIALGSECLVFRLASGESVPLSVDMVSVEVIGDTTELFEPEFVQQAANAVFHYFKYELGVESVTVADFAAALEKVLHGFKLTKPEAKPATDPARARVLESDLVQLARESGSGGELVFFPRLRDELRHQLQQGPQVLRFRGLRRCVKQIVGVRRWTVKCQGLQDQIVAFLRECLTAESQNAGCSMVVE